MFLHPSRLSRSVLSGLFWVSIGQLQPKQPRPVSRRFIECFDWLFWPSHFRCSFGTEQRLDSWQSDWCRRFPPSPSSDSRPRHWASPSLYGRAYTSASTGATRSCSEQTISSFAADLMLTCATQSIQEFCSELQELLRLWGNGAES